jgi:hypothetical protein
VIGIAAIYSDYLINLQGMSLTTMAVFGTSVMYITSMLSRFKLRKNEPKLERSSACRGYPIVPEIALLLAGGDGLAHRPDRPDLPWLDGPGDLCLLTHQQRSDAPTVRGQPEGRGASAEPGRGTLRHGEFPAELVFLQRERIERLF